jgi:hypothetical protein
MCGRYGRNMKSAWWVYGANQGGKTLEKLWAEITGSWEKPSGDGLNTRRGYRGLRENKEF